MATLPRSVTAAGFCGLLTLGSCAWASHDRRLLLNLLDDNLTPASTTGRWLASPVALPVGIVAGITDAVLVHPVTQMDDAWGDTVDLLWDSDRETGFRRALLTPVMVLATPLVFLGDWAGRSVFDVPDREDGEPDDETSAEPAGPGAEPLEEER